MRKGLILLIAGSFLFTGCSQAKIDNISTSKENKTETINVISYDNNNDETMEKGGNNNQTLSQESFYDLDAILSDVDIDIFFEANKKPEDYNIDEEDCLSVTINGLHLYLPDTNTINIKSHAQRLKEYYPYDYYIPNEIIKRSKDSIEIGLWAELCLVICDDDEFASIINSNEDDEAEHFYKMGTIRNLSFYLALYPEYVSAEAHAYIYPGYQEWCNTYWDFICNTASYSYQSDETLESIIGHPINNN